MAIFSKIHPPNSTKSYKFLSLVLKDRFLDCHTCNRRRLSYSSSDEEDTPASDFDDAQEMIVSMIRSRAIEAKYRRKRSLLSERDSSVIHPMSGELFLGTPKRQACDDCCAGKQGNSTKEDEETDDFTSVQSHLSRLTMTSADDTEAFFSVKTNFSRCSSLKDTEFADTKWWISETLDSSELRRRAIIQEFCHCEGWPFGLCRKALLLPPLPKSPSESWSWCKSSAKIAKTH